MRIGILTFHAAHNYGAVLQCYALQEYLKSIGHNVQVIDYRNPYIIDCYKPFRTSRFVRKNIFKMICLLYQEIYLYPKRRSRSNAFDDFIQHKLDLAPIESIMSDPYDIILIGSDQVWNINLTNGFDEYYWGSFERPKQTKVCTYAASMQDKWSVQESYVISDLLSNFDSISMREKSTAEQISRLIEKEVWQVVDPTLLFDDVMWNQVASKSKIKEPYVLAYQVEPNPIVDKIAHRVSEERKLRIVRLSANVADENDNEVISSSPADFISLFKHAAFIVCSSFHGTVFSLQFKKNFYSVRGNGKNARVQTLLSMANMNDRFVAKCPDVITDSDYHESIIGTINKSSIDYINKITNGK